MNFGNPAFLYVLPVVLVPIIIHFLKLYKTTTFYYSRVEDIKRLKKDQKKVKQLRDWLTLLLRTLAVLFLVLAFAKPSFSPNNDLSKDKNTSLHFVIDNSPSNLLGSESGLNAYKTAAINALENLPENQSVTLSFAQQTLDNVLINDAIKAVSNLTVVNQPFNSASLNDTLSEKYIFSDFQSSEWRTVKGIKSNYYTSETTSSNISIDTAYIINSQGVSAGKDLIIHFSRSDKANEKTSFEMTVNKRSSINKILDFGSQNILIDTIKISTDTTLFSSLKLSVEDPNGLLFDNEYFVSLAPRKKATVLVYGSLDNNPVFEKLLSRDSDYNYQYIKQGRDNFTGKQYNNLLIVAGINTIDVNLKAELQRLVKSGGACLFFPGEAIDKTINAYLESFRVSLTKQDTKDNQLQGFNFQHPYFSDVFDQIPNNPSLPIASDVYTIDNAPGYSELIKGVYGSLASQIKQQDFHLILTGIPFSETSENRSFFQHALFVPFALKALELHSSDNVSSTIVGNRLYSTKLNDGLAKLVRDGANIAELPWQKQFGKSFLNLDGITLLAGFYELNTGTESEMIAINAPRSESQLEFLSEDQLSEKGFLKTDALSDDASYSLLDFENNDAYLFFALMFICLLLESLINKFLSHESKAIQRG
jgi:hypothetical protein